MSSNLASRNTAINATATGEAASAGSGGTSQQQQAPASQQTGDSTVGNVQVVIDLSDEMAGNTSSSSSAASIQHQASSAAPLANPNNSTPRILPSAATSEVPLPSATTVAEVELTSSSSDECEFVLERKPPHLRTPEMVSLDSASDSDVVFVDESMAPTMPTGAFAYSDEEAQEQANIHIDLLMRKKISAMFQPKKRKRNANAVKDEGNKAAADLYNEGASTSAGIRSSLRKRRQKTKADSDQSVSRRSMEKRRRQYALRNKDPQQQVNVWSQESNSNSTESMSSYISTAINSSNSGTLMDETTSLDDTSDTEYVASAAQRRPRKSVATKRANRLKGKTNKRKEKANSKRHKRTQNNSESESDEENDHEVANIEYMRKCKTNQKNRRQNLNSMEEEHNSTHSDNDEDEHDNDCSEGENSWRLKAVNEPLRKRQQTASTLLKNPANRRRKLERRDANKNLNAIRKQEQQIEEDTLQPKRLRIEEGCKPKDEAKPFRRSSTSDDESDDDINLGDLKTKLKSCEDLFMKINRATAENSQCANTSPKEQQKQQHTQSDQQEFEQQKIHEHASTSTEHVSPTTQTLLNLAHDLPSVSTRAIKQEDGNIKQEQHETPSNSTTYSAHVMVSKWKTS